MINEFQYRHNKLYELLEAKDKEIAEYKLEGGVITRSNNFNVNVVFFFRNISNK